MMILLVRSELSIRAIFLTEAKVTHFWKLLGVTKKLSILSNFFGHFVDF